MKVWKYLLPTFVYYLTFFVVWSFVFWRYFGFERVCFCLDTFSLSIYNLVYSVICFISCYYFFVYLKYAYAIIINVRRVRLFVDKVLSIKYSFGLFGGQGTGKTYVTMFILWLLQPYKWFDLQYKTYKDYPIRDYLMEQARNGDLFSWKLYKTRVDSLKYYLNNEGKFVPCLYTPPEQVLKVGNRISYSFRKEHFTLKARLPENNIIGGEEFGDMFNNTTRRKDLSAQALSKKSPEEIEALIETENLYQFAGTQRQSTNGMTVLNDQRGGDISLAFRGVCDHKIYLVSNDIIYQPNLLKKIKSWVESLIVKKGENCSLRLHKFDKFVGYCLDSMGFMKIGYYEVVGAEEVSVKEKEIKYLSLPLKKDYSYYNRAYLLKNPTLDMPFDKV